MLLFVEIFALAVLASYWYMGDSSMQAKGFAGVAYLGTWCLADLHPLAPFPAQALFSIVLGLVTFGADWGRR